MIAAALLILSKTVRDQRCKLILSAAPAKDYGALPDQRSRKWLGMFLKASPPALLEEGKNASEMATMDAF